MCRWCLPLPWMPLAGLRDTRVPILLDFPRANKRGALAVPGPAANTAWRSWTCTGRRASRPRGTTSSSYRPRPSTPSQTVSAASVSQRRARALRGCGTCLSSSSSRSTTTRLRVSRSVRTCASALRANAHATTSLSVVARRTSRSHVARTRRRLASPTANRGSFPPRPRLLRLLPRASTSWLPSSSLRRTSDVLFYVQKHV